MEGNIHRLKAIISYDGTHFSGYQVQPNKRTVQSELEKALAKMHKADSWHVTGSGRTDSGVHSLGQTVHFDTTLVITEERWKHALNSLLPNDILVCSVSMVDEAFHARYDPVGKKYIYKVNTAKEKNVFQRNFVYHLCYDLSYDRMAEAAQYLTGTHNFTSFSSAKTTVVDKVRTIYSIEIKREQNDEDWTFTYIGSGFLYQMVRILTGTLLEIGKGKMEPGEIEKLIAAEDRVLAGPTAPGNGLYLASVYYEEAELELALKGR